MTTRLVMGGVAWQPNKRAAKKPSNYGEDPITATLMNEKEGTLIVTNTSNFSDDLFLTKNWAAEASCRCPTIQRGDAPVRAYHDQR